MMRVEAMAMAARLRRFLLLLACAGALLAGRAWAQSPGEQEQIARDADKLRQYILGLRGFKWDDNHRQLQFLGEGRLRRLLEIKFQPMGARLAFTPQVNQRGSGNPDIDKIALPQFSLNYDPILGRYWWE
jgi:hypothetical protein